MSFVLNDLQSGRTPLHGAALGWRNEQVVKTLIDAGADVNMVDKVRKLHNIKHLAH